MISGIVKTAYMLKHKVSKKKGKEKQAVQEVTVEESTIIINEEAPDYAPSRE